MNIKPMGFFATPVSQDALLAYGEAFSGGERTAFTMGMALTWNFLASQVNESSKGDTECPAT